VTAILVVEDDRLNQRVARAFLSRLGHDAVIASDAMEALAALAERRFDLVLMDLQLPHMDGLTATRKIRATGNTVPIVALTALAMQGDRRACLQAGMDGFLTKPLELEVLKQTISELLARSAVQANDEPESAPRPAPYDRAASSRGWAISNSPSRSRAFFLRRPGC